ncbi:MAG: hypothetical protein LC664_16650, partial [Flavobacteriales bacterium]|nr:hypothetical protein [Flavobacteriales bacterium]
GVFSLTGNLLEMATGAVFSDLNPFGENNMIVTGGDFANFGLLLNIPANTTDDIFVPLGIDRYMPINLDFSDGSSGTTDSKYLLRLNIPQVGVILLEDSVPVDLIDDVENVLGMYFSVDGTDVGDGLYLDLKFRYNQQYVQVTTPYTEEDYIAARVLANNTTISKLGSTIVDEINDILTFNIQGDFAGDDFAVDGDYFAGVDGAIPNEILEYETINDTPVDNGCLNCGYDEPVPGGGAPSGAIVTVSSGHELTFNIDGVNFYRTIIEENARLVIAGTVQHKLGKVSGEGTIVLQDLSVLPSGDYSDFFGCGGGKLEFWATSDDLEVLANMPPIEGVTFIGPNQITIANSSVNICNNIIINGGATVRAANEANLNIEGNVEIINGDFDFRQGDALIKGDLIVTNNPFITFFNGFALAGNNGELTIEGNINLGGRGMNLGTVFRETHL